MSVIIGTQGSGTATAVKGRQGQEKASKAAAMQERDLGERHRKERNLPFRKLAGRTLKSLGSISSSSSSAVGWSMKKLSNLMSGSLKTFAKAAHGSLRPTCSK